MFSSRFHHRVWVNFHLIFLMTLIILINRECTAFYSFIFKCFSRPCQKHRRKRGRNWSETNNWSCNKWYKIIQILKLNELKGDGRRPLWRPWNSVLWRGGRRGRKGKQFMTYRILNLNQIIDLIEYIWRRRGRLRVP